jgi:tetratricopeptide (TPR) repeat protein
MVTPATSHFEPPKSWEEFEDICADLFSREWNDPSTTRYGRQGQRQNGVDIYGRPGGKRYAAVQCKGCSKWPPNKLKTTDIDAEVEEAKKFKPKLRSFTIATVGPNDGPLQDHARKITERHGDKLFSVHVIGWSEITRRLTQHPELIEKHYGYVGNAAIKAGIDQLSDLVKSGLKGPEAQAPSLAVAADRSIARALERDLETRYEDAIRRQLFPESISSNEFDTLADQALSDDYAGVDQALRRRVLLRGARAAAVRNDVTRARELVDKAEALTGSESSASARARIAESEGKFDSAIAILRDEVDPESRSTLMSVLLRARQAQGVLEWFDDTQPPVSVLRPNGIQTLCVSYLHTDNLRKAQALLAGLTAEQLGQGPYLYFMRAAAHLASVLPPPEQMLAFQGLPMEVVRARVVVPDSIAAQRLDEAIGDLNTLVRLLEGLSLPEGKRIAESYLTWCELLHPSRKAAGLGRLRREMEDMTLALSRLQFAFAYDDEFSPDEITRYLERREKFGGLNDLELRGMLVIRLHGSDPAAVAQLINSHRSQLSEAISPDGLLSIEVQALAKSGQTTDARRIFEQRVSSVEPMVAAILSAELAKAEGADAVAEDMQLYETTRTVESLRSLVGSIERRRDYRALAKYAEELFEKTNDPRDIIGAAHALRKISDDGALIQLVERHSVARRDDANVERAYGWALFQAGRLREAKNVTASLRSRGSAFRDLHLEIAVAVESGEWETLAEPLTAFLDEPSKHSGLELIRAAHLSQASGQGPMMKLLRAAVAKEDADAHVWLGAYTLAVEEDLEDSLPDAQEWFRKAIELSGSEGPVRRVELKEILPQQQAWNERTRSISEMIARGNAPLIIAAGALRTTIVDLLLRNLVRNSALSDPRKQVAVPLFGGGRSPERCGSISAPAFDMSALLVMGWLGILPKAFSAFPQVVLPGTILTELFEGRRRIQRLQKSQIKRAKEIEGITARGRLKTVPSESTGQDPMTEEVGPHLAGLITAADAADAVVLRPAPVHRPGLDQIPSNISAMTSRLADMHALLQVLVDQGAIDQATEQTARQYFFLQDAQWPNPARPDPNRPLFIDGLALVYLQFTGLLASVLQVFKDVRIESATYDEAMVVIEHDRHVAEVLSYIDSIRSTIREANSAGKIVFGGRKTARADSPDDISPSTLHLLSDLTNADAVICDDRALNKDPFAQDVHGKRVRSYHTLDVLDELQGRSIISPSELRTLRHRLRVAGAALMPVTPHEIVDAVQRSGATKSAELRAIESSIDLARIAEVPNFPKEIHWFATLNMVVKAALIELWKSDAQPDRWRTNADVALDLMPDPTDWAPQWTGTLPLGWVEAVRGVSVASLAVPMEFAGEKLRDYLDWVEERVVEPLRINEPRLYERVVETVKHLIEATSEAGEDDDETPA